MKILYVEDNEDNAGIAASARGRVLIRILAAVALLMASAACTIGIGVTNAPVIADCIPGSATKPCP